MWFVGLNKLVLSPAWVMLFVRRPRIGVQALVGRAPVCQLGIVTRGEEGEFGCGKTGPQDFEQGEARVSVQLESGVEWFSSFKSAVAYKVDILVILKAS